MTTLRRVRKSAPASWSMGLVGAAGLAVVLTAGHAQEVPSRLPLPGQETTSIEKADTETTWRQTDGSPAVLPAPGDQSPPASTAAPADNRPPGLPPGVPLDIPLDNVELDADVDVAELTEDAVPNDELAALAVDIARRTLLAQHPHTAKSVIYTAEIMVRPQGDVTHLYARLIWMKHPRGHRSYHSEVFATLVNVTETRRVFDLDYKDNCGVPFHNFGRAPEIISMINDDLKQRDKFGMPHPSVGPDLEYLAPRTRRWLWNGLSGDRQWHVSIADDRVAPRWRSDE